MAPPDPSLLDYPAAVLALWGEKDEEASDTWRNTKITNWEEGGDMKEKYETREALDAWLMQKVYGPGGTMDKTLISRAARGRYWTPKLFKNCLRQVAEVPTFFVKVMNEN